MMIPSVHLNGTSKQELLDGYVNAATALRHALVVVRATAPNGRDYYPQGAESIRQAEREYSARIEKIDLIVDELMALATAVDEGGHKRA